MALSRPVFIVAAKRTAFGGFGGSFKNVPAIQLGQKASAAVLLDAKLDPGKVNSVIFGNVIQVDFYIPYSIFADGLFKPVSRLRLTASPLEFLALVLSFKNWKAELPVDPRNDQHHIQLYFDLDKS